MMTVANSLSDTGASPIIPDAATITSVTHWSERLFSFRVERPAALRFRSGEFVMLGLMGEVNPATGKQRPLLRAYSIASPAWEEELEFYSIKVADGPLTSRLQHVQPGQQIVLRPKPVGTLVLDALLPGERLWLMATGTGIAPFASLLRDPETYDRFNQVVLMHTCRDAVELDYGRVLVDDTLNHEFLGEMARGKLIYYPTTTREASAHSGRITDNISSDEFFQSLGIEPLNAAVDRCMVCGSLDFNVDLLRILEEKGFSEGSSSEPSSFVIEKAFVD